MTRLSITSTANDRLKGVRRLRRRHRDELFLVEGHRPLARALANGARIREVFAAPQLFLGPNDARLVTLAERRGARVYELGSQAFASISGGARPDGLAAVVERPGLELGRLRLNAAPLVVVAEGTERPGNLGALVRVACAAGAAMLVCDAPTDVLHPDVVRGSVGTIFDLSIAATSTDAALAWLAEHGIRVVVATPDGVRAYWDADYAGAVAVVVGSERHGVTEPWLAAAADTVRVPMAPPADSLNVAVAAGVLVFEAVRRRAG